MTFALPAGAVLVDELGAGSMFEVALVTIGGRRAVCKRLRSRMRGEAAARAAMWRERDVLGLARHAALPEIMGHGEDGHGPFLFESVVEGEQLSRLVEAGLPASMLPAMLRAAFAALAEVHALSDEDGSIELALGDIGPDHVIVGKQRGRIGFVDFGQASWRDCPARDGERGTLPFAAPEVLRGDALLSQRTDVYALAASFAYAALGREPCATSGPARLPEISERGLDVAAIEACDALSAGDRAALVRALHLDPAARVDSAAAVLQELATAP